MLGTGDSKPSAIQRTTIAIALALMLVALWALTHRYQGLAHDGELYALQALARIHPALRTDLYLQNTSQDRYTIFSRIYASFIEIFGLQNAELLLFVSCTACFLGAAWILARRLSNREAAWPTVALLITTVGYYGAYQIFHYSEDYLTARSLAEAMVITSLACHFCGWRRMSLLIAIAALFVHPLMALPGVLLLICLWLPLRQAVIGSVAGILAALGIAITARIEPAAMHFFTVLDPVWLDVVRERSQFLFLQYWSAQDWELCARPFVCLTITALTVDDERIRELCAAAMIVGATGLAVALIACAIGPVAILLQGQAWRWVWITGFVSVLLLAPTVLRVWRDEKCGPICSVLLVVGWTCSAVDGLACTEAVLILWLARAHISARVAQYLGWAAYMVSALVVAWILAKFWTFASSPAGEPGRDHSLAGRLGEFFELRIPALVLAGLFWRWIGKDRSARVVTLVCAALLGASVVILPGTFKQLGTAGTRAEIAEFAGWRSAIPPTSTVLLVPARNSASFAWFTLGRTSYMSVNQSSGVVFARATALEVRRRSEVLLPLMDPDWQILTHITEKRAGKRKDGAMSRPLTAKTLIGICGDPQLGFVVARENLGFAPIRHSHAGVWKDWNLYDCRHVRAMIPAA